MDLPADAYRIRLARPDDIPRVREIEDVAGTMFTGLAVIDEALDVSFPLASVMDDAVYVEEMDVVPARGRRGLGARLLARSAAGRRREATARSPCRPSATCRGTARSTGSRGSGTCSPPSGRRACG